MKTSKRPQVSVQAATALVAAALLFPAVAAGQQPQRLEFADTQKPFAGASALPEAAWAADGVHLRLGKGEAAVLWHPKTGQQQPAPAEVTLAAPRTVVRIHDGDLYLDTVAAAGNAPRPGGVGDANKPSAQARRLTTDGKTAAKREEAQLAPDQRAVSFVEGNNLRVLELDGGAVWSVTTDGGPELFHGVLDWVYQEEIYGRGRFQGHWWRPDSAAVAFLSLDESPVRDFTLVDHVPPGFLESERSVQTEVSNYPKSGDGNPFARMTIAHRASRELVAVDLSAWPKDLLVMRVDWTPDGRYLLLSLSDRIQTWAELVAVDPATGKATAWIKETSKSWVNRTESPRWLPDGSFLWRSERTGYAHLYRYAQGGELLQTITAGEWQVRSIERIDAERGLLWFEGTREGATGRHFYRVGLDGSGLVHLTPGVGTHQVSLDARGDYLLDRWSAMDRLPTLRVLDGNTGAVVREIATAGPGDTARYAWVSRERLTIKARDGYLLDATIQRPLGWQPTGSYPVFLPTYSGPNALTVRDQWAPSLYHQFLCEQGFLVLQVNVRSASGRGLLHTSTCYQQLGVQELRDLEDAVDHVVRECAADASRVAISGWSYGGFMAAYALTHSDRFALGLAGAGVYDWQLYDTIYTERYMRMPQQNAEGYQRTSVIRNASKLRGHLVLLHGTMDDNVHMQNTLQLVYELQRLGKQNFELMLYPRSRHGLAPGLSKHSQEFQWLRLQRLLVGKPQ